MIEDRIYAMDDTNLVFREYELSLETSLLIRGWIQDNTEGKNVPIFLLEESLEQITIELKLMREEMLKRDLEKRCVTCTRQTR